MKRIIPAFFLIVLYNVVFSQVLMTKTPDGLLITEKGKRVLFYRIKPLSLDGKYERCNYIHPLWGIDGNILSEDFPEDHLHHRGIFWTWHQVWIDSMRIGDPWEIKDFKQEVVSARFEKLEGGAGLLTTEVLWESPLWKKDGQIKPYMKENAEIVIHPKRQNSRRIDFTIHLLALEENLKIGGSQDVKGYSGFSVRVKLPDDVQFSGVKGVVEPKNEAVESEGYINVSGSMGPGGKKAGVVIIDHPSNPGYPQPWILRNKNSMQNAAWPGNTTTSLSTEKPLQLKYSLIIYKGDYQDQIRVLP